MLASLQSKMKEFDRTSEGMQLILNESILRKSLAYFEHVKKLQKKATKRREKFMMI